MFFIRSALVAALILAALCGAEDKGVCPPLPPTNAKRPKPNAPPLVPSSDTKNIGTVTLLLVVSNKGYVCSSRVLKGINNELDQQAQSTAQTWRFDPAQKNGRAVPVVISVGVNFKTNNAGEIVLDPLPSQSPHTSEKPRNTSTQ